MTDKQGSSDVARVRALIAFCTALGGEIGDDEMAADAAALTRVLAEREADQEALKRADELAEASSDLTCGLEPDDDYANALREATDAFRAARSGEGR